MPTTNSPALDDRANVWNGSDTSLNGLENTCGRTPEATVVDHERVALMWADARLHLIRQANPLSSLVASLDPISHVPEHDRLRALVSAIVGQQLSTRAASTIRSRLLRCIGPGGFLEALDRADDAALVACGLSNAKLRSVRDLTSRIRDGSLPLHAFDAKSDDEVRQSLLLVKGVGPWTADMFLIFSMCRPDVLATTDLGIQVAVGRLLGLPGKADPTQVAVAAKAGGWHPFASAACLYLWRSLDGPGALNT